MISSAFALDDRERSGTSFWLIGLFGNEAVEGGLVADSLRKPLHASGIYLPVAQHSVVICRAVFIFCRRPVLLDLVLCQSDFSCPERVLLDFLLVFF